MPIIAKLSGEDPDLPLAEVKAILEPLEPHFDALGNRIMRIDRGNAFSLSRAAMVHWAGNVLQEVSSLDCLEDFNLEREKYRIDLEGFSRNEKGDVISTLDEHIHGGSVDLDRPDVRLLLLKNKNIHLVAIKEEEWKGHFSERRPHKRTFFSPISMMPKQARLLCNLARVRPGQRVLDPMCGTGGILIEAGFIGARLLASDIQRKMVKGTAENLERFGFELERCEACPVAEIEERFSNVDAIVTDPPYGRSSTTGGQAVDELMDVAFSSFSKTVNTGGFVGLALPSLELVEKGRKYMELVESHPYKIHGSLTRHFTVFRRYR